ncbi:MAG: serine/threonine protein kinase [Betaproteobacteria bacterium]|nr:serine/threonine protein kinase [Betaproteobacteria bacterium]MDH4324476.1 serine/threonine protein kinase [Betaproteobacteria bacterium]MDH5210369.1 serine/threonine protein kinase [Betaproteobacteria bacterium]
MAKRTKAEIPTHLGKYSISEVLGKGAMGIVYKGYDPHIHRIVALKTIRKELLDDEQGASLLARFRNEAQAAGRLSHPGIVGVYEWGEDDDVVFLAMEYVEGNSLRDYFVRGTRFDSRDMVSVMVQLLNALQHAHEQGVWHRDVKPANIIVMRNGTLKVADFGIARIDSSNLTQVGAIMGTPGYMSPEQYSGAAADWRADIFAAGVVMYQLLTGERPFTGSAESIAYRICHEEPPLPSAAQPARCGPQFDAVVMMALAKKAEERFQDAAAFRSALLEAHAGPANPTLSEETILSEPERAASKAEPSQPPHPSQPSRPSHPSLGVAAAASGPGAAAPSKTVPPPGWDAATLKQIEQQMARIVGPVGKVLVRRAALQTTDVEALYALLAENLSDPAERAALLEGRPQPVKARAAPAAHGAATAATAGAPLTPEAIELATRRLATYLGPIAKVVAHRAAAQAGSRRQFLLLLAESLAHPGERARFLREVGAD